MPAHENTEGCAIGCVLPRPVAEVFDNSADASSGTSIHSILTHKGDVPEVQAALSKVPWLLDFNVEFLNLVQRLHDTSVYWNLDGLSGAGVMHVTSIYEKFLSE